MLEEEQNENGDEEAAHLGRLISAAAATTRQPVRHEAVTHILGTLRYPFVRSGQLLFGERGGTRTLDPMIKSHVLYRLSYALTSRVSICRCGKPNTTPSRKWQGPLQPIMLQTALCRGWAGAGQ